MNDLILQLVVFTSLYWLECKTNLISILFRHSMVNRIGSMPPSSQSPGYRDIPLIDSSPQLYYPPESSSYPDFLQSAQAAAAPLYNSFPGECESLVETIFSYVNGKYLLFMNYRLRLI